MRDVTASPTPQRPLEVARGIASWEKPIDETTKFCLFVYSMWMLGSNFQESVGSCFPPSEALFYFRCPVHARLSLRQLSSPDSYLTVGVLFTLFLELGFLGSPFAHSVIFPDP